MAAEYLLIESRDPFESNDVGYYYELACGLVEAGNQVTLFWCKMPYLRRDRQRRHLSFGD